MQLQETLTGNWHYPTRIRFGSGRISELADACASLGMHKPLLVSDPGLAALPMIAKAIADNRSAGMDTELFSDIKPNPNGANIEAGVSMMVLSPLAVAAHLMRERPLPSWPVSHAIFGILKMWMITGHAQTAIASHL